MALVFLPGQFARRAEYYYQLGQLTAAGFGLIGGLQQMRKAPPGREYREPISKVLARLQEGYTFAESLRNLAGWLPEFDVALIQAGEESGRLEFSFRLLADYYRDRAAIARQVIGDLAYPLALFHFAIFIFPFPQLFLTGNWVASLTQTLGILLPIYAVVLFLVFATQSRHGERWRSGVEAVLRLVPVLGTARQALAISRLAAALEALTSAGVTIIEAWMLAASASGSPALRREVFGWRPLLDAGQTPAEIMAASGRIPEIFANQYSSGEISGKLDETLGRLHQYYRDEGARKLHALAQWTPRAVYLGIVLLIAYRVVTFWMGYFQQIQNVMGVWGLSF